MCNGAVSKTSRERTFVETTDRGSKLSKRNIERLYECNVIKVLNTKLLYRKWTCGTGRRRKVNIVAATITVAHNVSSVNSALPRCVSGHRIIGCACQAVSSTVQRVVDVLCRRSTTCCNASHIGEWR